MRITYDIDLENFETWSGASATLEKIINEGKCKELETALEEMYPDGMDETQLNDILWFESDWCYEVCEIRSESKIEEELEETKTELEELMEEFEDAVSDEAEEINSNREIAGMNELDEEEMEKLRSKIWNDYIDDAEELKERIEELEEELEDF